MFHKAKRNPALLGASFYIALISICLSSSILLPVISAITQDSVMREVLCYSFGVVCVAFSYYRYKREKDRILREFKDSKYNKIPYWCLVALVPICGIIGATAAVYISRIFQ